MAQSSLLSNLTLEQATHDSQNILNPSEILGNFFGIVLVLSNPYT